MRGEELGVEPGGVAEHHRREARVAKVDRAAIPLGTARELESQVAADRVGIWKRDGFADARAAAGRGERLDHANCVRLRALPARAIQLRELQHVGIVVATDGLELRQRGLAVGDRAARDRRQRLRATLAALDHRIGRRAAADRERGQARARRAATGT